VIPSKIAIGARTLLVAPATTMQGPPDMRATYRWLSAFFLLCSLAAVTLSLSACTTAAQTDAGPPGPAPCDSLATCGDCLSNECAWCTVTSTCVKNTGLALPPECSYDQVRGFGQLNDVEDAGAAICATPCLLSGEFATADGHKCCSSANEGGLPLGAEQCGRSQIGDRCATGDDCADGLPCVNGSCECSALGTRCYENSDCCGASNPAIQCVAPPDGTAGPMLCACVAGSLCAEVAKGAVCTAPDGGGPPDDDAGTDGGVDGSSASCCWPDGADCSDTTIACCAGACALDADGKHRCESPVATCAGPAAACTRGADCCSGDCVNGACSTGCDLLAQIPCATSADCGGGACPDADQRSDECAYENICSSYSCLCAGTDEECVADRDCKTGSCVGGVCTPRTTGEPCNTKSDCLLQSCVAGKCAPIQCVPAGQDVPANQGDPANPAGQCCSYALSNDANRTCACSPTSTKFDDLGNCITDADCCAGKCDPQTQECSCVAGSQACVPGDVCCTGDACPASGVCPCVASGGTCVANVDGCCSPATCARDPSLGDGGPVAYGTCIQPVGSSCSLPSDCQTDICTNGACACVPFGAESSAGTVSCCNGHESATGSCCSFPKSSCSTTADCCDFGSNYERLAFPPVCQSGQCCQPRCAVGSCDEPDDCGGTCAGCPATETCTSGHICECSTAPLCDGVHCGFNNGCGKPCGCVGSQICNGSGTCVAPGGTGGGTGSGSSSGSGSGSSSGSGSGSSSGSSSGTGSGSSSGGVCAESCYTIYRASGPCDGYVGIQNDCGSQLVCKYTLDDNTTGCIFPEPGANDCAFYPNGEGSSTLCMAGITECSEALGCGGL